MKSRLDRLTTICYLREIYPCLLKLSGKPPFMLKNFAILIFAEVFIVHPQNLLCDCVSLGRLLFVAWWGSKDSFTNLLPTWVLNSNEFRNAVRVEKQSLFSIQDEISFQSWALTEMDISQKRLCLGTGILSLTADCQLELSTNFRKMFAIFCVGIY